MPNPTPAKAAEMLQHGSVRGRALTAQQRRFFHAIKGGRKRFARLKK